MPQAKNIFWIFVPEREKRTKHGAERKREDECVSERSVCVCQRLRESGGRRETCIAKAGAHPARQRKRRRERKNVQCMPKDERERERERERYRERQREREREICRKNAAVNVS
jgi:hypothetical protein